MKTTNFVFAKFGRPAKCDAHVMQAMRDVQVVIARVDARRLQLTMSADEADALAVQLHNSAQLARLWGK